MGQNQVASPSEIFIKELRSALNHLYDPDFLRSSSLAVILGVAGRFDTPSALQGILARAIESLKPVPGAPNKDHAQAVYDLLLYRYVQQFNQDEIANQLGISVRHLRRQQNQSVYELACSLWSQIQQERDARPPEPVIQETSSTALPADLDWVRDPSGQVATDLAMALEEARVLIQPFVEQHNVSLTFPSTPTGLILVHPVAFQQILLSLLSTFIQYAAGQAVSMQLTAAPGWHTLEIHAAGADQDPGMIGENTWVKTVQHMIQLSGGRLDFQYANGQFLARFAFRKVDQIDVLVIDDNPEIITMMQRFTAETRFRILGLNDPQLAVERAIRVQPDLIVLDIMMPQVDGLHVLSRIKHHPGLNKLPVIICSVLPQKDLAESLGASGFIKKPIQREEFVNALDWAFRKTSLD